MSDAAKLLVVDDDSLMVDFAVRVLESLGYRTTSAMDAPTALERLREDPEVRGAMVDLRLGHGPDGALLAQEMLKVRSDIALILTSGAHGSLQAAAEAMPKTVGLLPKPFRRRDVAACLSRLI